MNLIQIVETALILAFISELAFRFERWFLYILACPLGLIFGLTLASQNTPATPLWVGGAIIAIFGAYCLFKVVEFAFAAAKKKRES